jgi:hypothetical protein
MFLSVITRTYLRPKMFEANRKSLAMQTLQDIEAIVIRDEVGIGCAEANHRLCLVEPQGDYVWVFDDDNVLEDDSFIQKAKELVDQLHPDVIFVKGWVVGQILPDKWPLERGHVDTMNFIVKKELWNKYKSHWDIDYAGDWTFINEVMQHEPMIAWLDMIACKTIRGSRGAKEEWDYELPPGLLSRDPNRAQLRATRDTIKVGDIIKSRVEAAGIGFLCHENEEIEITNHNFDHCEGLLRAGRADFVSAAPEVKRSNKRVLVFCPIGGKLEPETRDAIFAQEGVEFCDVMFTRDNFYSPVGSNAGLNIQHAYQKMKKIVLENGYDKAWICEADMIPPKDALVKLLEIDAPVVTGLYMLRHGSPVTNLMKITKDLEGYSQTEIREMWGKTVKVGGGCMGCVLIDRTVLERFSFITQDQAAPDIPFMQLCVENKVEQIARLDVICGHKKPTGEILYPDRENIVRIERAA